MTSATSKARQRFLDKTFVVSTQSVQGACGLDFVPIGQLLNTGADSTRSTSTNPIPVEDETSYLYGSDVPIDLDTLSPFEILRLFGSGSSWHGVVVSRLPVVFQLLEAVRLSPSPPNIRT